MSHCRPPRNSRRSRSSVRRPETHAAGPIQEVICGPARRAGEAGSPAQIAPELVDRLLDRLVTRRGYAAAALAHPFAAFQDYGDGGITLAEYDAMGGLRHVVRERGRRIVGSGSCCPATATGHSAGRVHAVAGHGQPGQRSPNAPGGTLGLICRGSHPLLEGFIAKRLLVRDDRDGVVVVEVALESLLRQWDALADWLRVEAGDLKDADNVERAARAWRQNGCSDEWLIPGSRLADAEALAAKPGFRERLNPTSDFLLASRRAQIAEERSEADLGAAKALAEAETAKEDAERHASALRTELDPAGGACTGGNRRGGGGILIVRATNAEERPRAPGMPPRTRWSRTPRRSCRSVLGAQRRRTRHAAGARGGQLSVQHHRQFRS